MTATALSRLLGGEISHDQVTRFLASPARTVADLWRVVKPLVWQITRQKRPAYPCAYVKLEGLKISTGLKHFALKSMIYLSALQTGVFQIFCV